MSNHQCRLVCVHRASGTEAGARVLYEFLVGLTSIDKDQWPQWEDLPEKGKKTYMAMFRKAHKACKEAIVDEPRL